VIAGAGRWVVDSKRLAEIGQELADAARNGVVSFDLARPTLAAGLVGKFELGGVALTQPRGVLGCGDELRAGQEQVALARAFGWQTQAVAKLEFGAEEVVLESVDCRGCELAVADRGG
jgi:hypothetical protein